MKICTFKVVNMIIMCVFMVHGIVLNAHALSGIIIFSNNDYGCGWERNPGWTNLSVQNSIEIGLNLAIFAASGSNTLEVRQIRHNGRSHSGDFNWNPDPGSIENFERDVNRLTFETGLEVTTGYADLGVTDLSHINMLYLTGSYSFSFSDLEKAALKSFIDRGGILFADDCAGLPDWGFESDFRALVQELYGNPLEVLPPEHDIYSSYYALNGNDFSYSYPGNGTQGGTCPLEGLASGIEICIGTDAEPLRVTPFAETINLQTGAKQRDPGILVVSCGAAKDVKKVVRPPLDQLTDTGDDLRLDIRADRENPVGVFLESLQSGTYTSIIHNRSLSAVNTATLHNLIWQSALAGKTLPLSPDQVVVFKTVMGEPLAMQFQQSQGIQAFDVAVKHFHYCPSAQIDDIKIVTPEPATLTMFGLGAVGLFAGLRRKSRRVSLKLFVMFALLFPCLTFSPAIYAQEDMCSLAFQKSGTGAGTLWIGDQECGNDCESVQIDCQSATAYVLKAIPAPGSKFVRWEDGAGNPIDLATYEVFSNTQNPQTDNCDDPNLQNCLNTHPIVAVFEQFHWSEACADSIQKVYDCTYQAFLNSEACRNSYNNALSDLEKFYQEKNILIGFSLANAFNNESCQDASKGCKAAYDELFACVYPLATDCWDCITTVYNDADDACYGPIYDASTKEEILHCPQAQIAVENCFNSLNPDELTTFYGNDACECTMRASMRAECGDASRGECSHVCSGK